MLSCVSGVGGHVSQIHANVARLGPKLDIAKLDIRHIGKLRASFWVSLSGRCSREELPRVAPQISGISEIPDLGDSTPELAQFQSLFEWFEMDAVAGESSSRCPPDLRDLGDLKSISEISEIRRQNCPNFRSPFESFRRSEISEI